MNTDAKWIDNLRGRNLDLSHQELGDVQKLISAGELVHIEGALVTALADLADAGRAEYLGFTITRGRPREGSDWPVYHISEDGKMIASEEGAIGALLECQRRDEKRRRKSKLAVWS